jgi:hypothetical protein
MHERIQCIPGSLWEKTNVFHDLPQCTSTTTISLDLAISPSCQFSLSFSSCPGLALMRKWILWPTSSYISSKRKSISAVTTFTLTLFPISRYFVFVETPPGHRNGSRILCKRWEDLDVGVKWNNLSNSEGEKYRSRSGSRMRTASTWPLH